MRGRTAALVCAAWIAVTGMLAALGPYAAVSGRGVGIMPEETPGLATAEVTRFLEALGAEGRAAYIRAQMLDYLVPLLGLAAALSVLSWATARLRLSDGVLALLLAPPALLAICEVVENTLLSLSARHHPGPLLAPGLRDAATSGKFVAYGLTVAIILGCAAMVSRRR